MDLKQKILIIDNDADLCRLLKNNLEPEGYQVCIRHDGVTGLEKRKITITSLSFWISCFR